MPIFPPARYLLGLPPDGEFEVRDLMVKVAVRLTYLDDPPRAFPGVQQEIYYRSFARMLAKIAQCQAVAALGLDGFEPALAEIIRGKDWQWAQFVGCIPETQQPADNGRCGVNVGTLQGLTKFC